MLVIPGWNEGRENGVKVRGGRGSGYFTLGGERVTMLSKFGMSETKKQNNKLMKDRSEI